MFGDHLWWFIAEPVPYLPPPPLIRMTTFGITIAITAQTKAAIKQNKFIFNYTNNCGIKK